MANSLKLGCDCVGEIFYFDSIMINADCTPRLIQNAICLHEEDDGNLKSNLRCITQAYGVCYR
jgi:primary-amine oxidase